MSEKILRVDMDELRIEREDVPEKYEDIGGRYLWA